ncbi:hypothetical protein [Micromonospora craniellae]|uniref:Uncharacterized protein n=1 Tax=Micromonospora craniellae TaxID=2294034 RepID=A0A372FZZ3_9ACTN|nr:hypothetical protein [Micromonospora craniellae]QOC94574.1 hypothetical protein ID554_14025 [Micromonospora craniellae]RFS46365.1 hypothetical protein D0Q02_11310 [Micromonospora craniellae]
MRVWPFNRRREVTPIDRTGAATRFHNQAGAFRSVPTGEPEARAGHRWYADTQLLPFYTPAQNRRSGW